MKQVDLVYQLFFNSIVALIPTAIILKGKKKKKIEFPGLFQLA